MEKTTIIGHIGKDATINDVNGRKAINFTVGVNTKFKKQDGTEVNSTNWYSCARWMNSGESTEIAKYLQKGTQVYVEGKLLPAMYKNKDNQTAIDLKLHVREIKLLGSAKKQDPATGATPANNQGGSPFPDNDDYPF